MLSTTLRSSRRTGAMKRLSSILPFSIVYSLVVNIYNIHISILYYLYSFLCFFGVETIAFQQTRVRTTILLEEINVAYLLLIVL